MAANWTLEQVLAQLNSGRKWSGTSISYAFPTVAGGMYSQGEATGFRPIPVSQQATFELAISTWNDLIPQNFAKTTASTSNLEFAYTNTNIGYAHAYYPSNGSAWFLTGSDVVSATVGNYGFMTILHEIGHALGLDHMGDYNGQGSWTPSSFQDSVVLSVMSYFGPRNAAGNYSSLVMQADWVGSDFQTYTPQTPMVNDVMAIQAIYGTSTTTRTENSTYGFNCTISDASAALFDFRLNLNPILTIFDSAGIDTIDLSGWSLASTVSLVAGSYSSANAMTNNLAIAYDCVIENLVTGSGNDDVLGNDASNRLDTGAGNDTLTGGLGDDTLVGGGGNDTIIGGAGSDTAIFYGPFSSYTVSYNFPTGVLNLASAGAESDSVSGVEFFQFSDITKTVAQLLVADVIAPVLSSTSPTDNAADVAPGAKLVLQFNETVVPGSGRIFLYGSDGIAIDSTDISNTVRVQFAGRQVTVDFSAAMRPGTAYYVGMASGVVTDLAGNAYAGLSGSAAFNFTTSVVVDSMAPTIVSLSPADNGLGVAVNASLLLTFSETVQAGSGNIIIYNAGGTVVQTIPVSDPAQVAVSGAVVTVNPALDLAAGSGYYVNFASGVFKDMAGNPHAGIAGSSSYNFTTLSPLVNDDFPFSPETTGVVITGGSAVTGRIEVSNDVDLFKVELVAGTKYIFKLGSAVNGLSDPFLTLYGADMLPLRFDDDSGLGLDSQITFIASVGGTHYLGASAAGSGTGAYLLSAEIPVSPPDDFEGSKLTTSVLAPGGSMAGMINFAGDEDWFRLTLSAGTTYVFNLYGADSGGGTLGANGNEAMLELFDSNGYYLKMAFDSGPGGDPQLTYTPTVNGTFFIAASDLYSGTGSYVIKAGTVLDDFRGDSGTQGVLQTGSQLSGTIETGGDEDWFKITLVAGTTYVFDLSGADSGGGTLGAGSAEAYLVLRDANGYSVKSAFNGPIGSDPQLTYLATVSGTFFLAVSDLRDTGTGTYSLSSKIIPTLTDDYADTTSTAGQVAIGAQTLGNIETAGDADWFAVTLQAGTSYVFDLRGGDGGGGSLGSGAGEAYLKLLGPTGSYLNGTSSGGLGGDPQLSFTPVVSGKYFLEASDLYDIYTGTYTVIAAARPDDFADNVATAGVITIGGTVSGNIEYAGDVDWVRVELTAGTAYGFQLKGYDSGGGTLGQQGEAYLRIYNSTGSLVNSTYSGGQGGDPRQYFKPATSGSYFLSASDLHSYTGTYTLQAGYRSDFNDDYGNDITFAGTLLMGKTVSANLEFAGDDDWFKVSLQAGNTYTFNLVSHANGGGTLGNTGMLNAPYLRLYGPASSFWLTSTYDGGPNGDPRITYTAATTGFHYLSASELFETYTGTYRVNVAVTGSTDVLAPTFVSVIPADEAGAVGVGSDLVLTFSENIGRGSGSILLKKADGTVVESFDVQSSTQLSFVGATLRVNPAANLASAATYRLELSAGNVTDVSGNSHAGLADYNFTTAAHVNTIPTGSLLVTGLARQGSVLTATSTLLDKDGLGTLSYQWKAAGLSITGATGSSLTLSQDQVGKTVTVTASYTDAFGTNESVTSSATVSVSNVNDAPSGAIAISGDIIQGASLSVQSTLADLDGLGAFLYQWKANGASVVGATGATFLLTGDHVGKQITVVVSYTDGYGRAESATSPATQPILNLNDAPVGTVLISGTPSQNRTLTATVSLSDADGLGAFSYQWFVNGVAEAGANEATLALQESHVGKPVFVQVTYVDGFGRSEAVASDPTVHIANVNDLPVGTVSISGALVQGETLTASSSLSDLDGMATLRYQWLADGIPLPGAVTDTLRLGGETAGKRMTVVVSYTDGHGTLESVTSNQTLAVENVNDAPTGLLQISGRAEQGQLLTVVPAIEDLDGLGTFAYQWSMDGAAVAGATASTLRLSQEHVGKSITVVARYTDGFGYAELANSVATLAVVNVNDLPVGAINISGSAMQGELLSATHTLADADGMGEVSYQWFANGARIAGATSAQLRLSEAEVNQLIMVQARYTDLYRAEEIVQSLATAPVANANDAPRGKVEIDGQPVQGQLLTASQNLSDLDGMGVLSFQWSADGAPIAGATASSLLLLESLVGKVINVSVGYTDGHGTRESVASDNSILVGNVNEVPGGALTIGGLATQGQTLTATSTLSDGDGMGDVTYAWFADGIALGVSGHQLVLSQAEVGKTISLAASYRDGHGTVENVKALPSAVVANVNDAPAGTLTITGALAQGEKLRAHAALTDADGIGTLLFDWFADGTLIHGEHGVELELTEGLVGRLVTVTASYVDGYGQKEQVTGKASMAVANRNDLPAGTVSISGKAEQGQVLTAQHTLKDADGLGAITYRWFIDGVLMNAESGRELSLTEAMVGKAISLAASYTDGHGSLEVVAGTSAVVIANVNDSPTGTVSVTGQAVQGQILSIQNSLSDPDGITTLNYEWFADGILITDATTDRLRLEQSLVGKKISATVSYRDGHDTTESQATGSTAPVANVNDLPTGVVAVTGAVSQGAMLTSSVSQLADLDGLGTLSYQWLAGGISIFGATGTQFALTESQVGSSISLQITFVDGFGTRETVRSNPTGTVSNVNDPGMIVVTGTGASEGLYTANLTDADGYTKVDWLWQSSANGLDWNAINGATSATFAKGPAYASLQVRATAVYTDSHGTVETVSSVALGSQGGDRIVGTSMVDIIKPAAGNDTITGGGGNDIIDGGAGLDTATYSGALSQYTIVRIAGGFTVTDTSGQDGLDTLSGIERLHFGASAIALDTGTDGVGGQSYRLYQAAFGRTPDAGGVGFWMSVMDNGMSLPDIAAGFIASTEYQSLYPASLNNVELVTRYYVNILGRPPEQAGLAYWASVLDNKVATIPQVLAFISESQENVDLTATVIGNGFPYIPFP